MKLAKKFMTLALATALGVGCATVGVSAAGSRTSAITVSAVLHKVYHQLLCLLMYMELFHQG